MDAELTLEKAFTAARHSELVKRQQSVVRGPEGSATSPQVVEAVHKGGRARGKSPKQSGSRPESRKCGRCGCVPGHARTACPAKDAKCHKCKKTGHYQAMCRSRGADVDVLEDPDDDPFLGVISSPEISSIGEDPW